MVSNSCSSPHIIVILYQIVFVQHSKAILTLFAPTVTLCHHSSRCERCYRREGHVSTVGSGHASYRPVAVLCRTFQNGSLRCRCALQWVCVTERQIGRGLTSSRQVQWCWRCPGSARRCHNLCNRGPCARSRWGWSWIVKPWRQWCLILAVGSRCIHIWRSQW